MKTQTGESPFVLNHWEWLASEVKDSDTHWVWPQPLILLAGPQSPPTWSDFHLLRSLCLSPIITSLSIWPRAHSCSVSSLMMQLALREEWLLAVKYICHTAVHLTFWAPPMKFQSCSLPLRQLRTALRIPRNQTGTIWPTMENPCLSLLSISLAHSFHHSNWTSPWARDPRGTSCLPTARSLSLPRHNLTVRQGDPAVSSWSLTNPERKLCYCTKKVNITSPRVPNLCHN